MHVFRTVVNLGAYFSRTHKKETRVFFFKQKTAYEMLRSLVGSEMCIRDSPIFVNGMRKKGSEPETVGNFIMGVDKSLRRPHDFCEWSAQKMI